jgi:hypothetical protein
MLVEIDLVARREVADPIVTVTVRRLADRTVALDISTAASGRRIGRLGGAATVTLTLDRLDLSAGRYAVDVGVFADDWVAPYDFLARAAELEVVSPVRTGALAPPHRWELAAGGTGGAPGEEGAP